MIKETKELTKAQIELQDALEAQRKEIIEIIEITTDIIHGSIGNNMLYQQTLKEVILRIKYSPITNYGKRSR